MSRQRSIYILFGLLIMFAGSASRIVHSGLMLIDNDLGEALYAALAYVLLGSVWLQLTPARKALITSVVVPAHFAASGNTALRLLAVVLGTTWRWRDLLGYAAGIAGIGLVDHVVGRKIFQINSA